MLGEGSRLELGLFSMSFNLLCTACDVILDWSAVVDFTFKAMGLELGEFLRNVYCGIINFTGVWSWRGVGLQVLIGAFTC